MRILAPFQALSPAQQRNIYVSIAEGVFYSFMVGAAESYFGAFGVFLNATPSQLGFLAALPPFFSAICQMASLLLLNRFPSRRPIIAVFAAIQAASIIPIALVPFLFPPGSQAVWTLLAFVVIYWGAAGFTAPLWNSLLGDLVPSDYRGRYYGIRSRWMGFATMATVLLAGGILHLFSTLSGGGSAESFHPTVAWGYLLIFVIAFVCRLTSSYFLLQHENPQYTPERPLPFSLRRVLRRAPHSNFAKFVFFVSAIQAGQAFSAPYFAPYMLKDLALPYWKFSILAAGPSVTLMVMHPFWGRMVDKVGCTRVISWLSFGVALNPLFWLVSGNVFWLFAVQLYSGFVWSGFNLAAWAFFFDAVPPSKRAYYGAYQGMIQGVFVLAGSLLGAFVVDRAPSLTLLDGSLASPYLFLFLVSGVIRVMSCVLLLRRFDDGKIVAAPEASPKPSRWKLRTIPGEASEDRGPESQHPKIHSSTTPEL